MTIFQKLYALMFNLNIVILEFMALVVPGFFFLILSQGYVQREGEKKRGR